MGSSGPHLVIVGLMGVGKSTAGRALAESLAWPYIDSDDDIERLLSMSGREFAADSGVEALHRLEAAVLIGALAAERVSVISAAASVVDDELVRLVLPRRAFVVRVHAPVDVILERQKTGGHRRPMEAEELVKLSARREERFIEVEDLVVDALRPVEEIVSTVRNRFPELDT